MAQMTVTPVTTQGFLVDGKWMEEGDLVEVRAPYDGSVIARVFQGRREHAEAAIAAAVKAFGTTRRLPAFERQRVLRRVAENITERKEEFARTLAQEAGKPIKAARTELGRAIFTFLSGLCDRLAQASCLIIPQRSVTNSRSYISPPSIKTVKRETTPSIPPFG